MQSFDDVIGKWPSDAQFARDVGLKPNHVQTMKARDSIPAEYWLDIVAAAEQRGYRDITLELFSRITRARRRSGASLRGANAGT
jgi:hypothetical protein